MRSFIFLPVVVLLFLVSCVERADLDPREQEVVVYCVLLNDSVQTVSLRYTSYISENKYPYVDEAEVSVSGRDLENDGPTEHYVFHKKGEGEWVSEFYPVPGYTYNLTVKIPNHKTITASTKYPKDDIRMAVYTGGNDVLPFYNYFANGVEIPSYWKENLDQEVLAKQTLRFKFFPYHFYTNTISVEDGNAIWIYGEDYDWVEEKYNTTEYIYSDLYGVEGFNISGVTGSMIEEFEQGEYEMGVPDVLSYGVPLYYATTSTYYNLKDKAFYHRYLRIPCDTISYKMDGPSSYSIFACQVIANFRQYYNGIAHPNARIVADLVSAEYDRYMKDILSFELGLDMKDTDDLTHLYEYREIYSNVENGLGVFGACKRMISRWATPRRVVYYKSDGGSIRYMNRWHPDYRPGGDFDIQEFD